MGECQGTHGEKYDEHAVAAWIIYKSASSSSSSISTKCWSSKKGWSLDLGFIFKEFETEEFLQAGLLLKEVCMVVSPEHENTLVWQPQQKIGRK